MKKFLKNSFLALALLLASVAPSLAQNNGSATSPQYYGTVIPSGSYFDPAQSGAQCFTVTGTSVGCMLSTGWSGNVSGTLVCSGTTPPTIGCYAPAANTGGLSARSLPAIEWTNPASAVNFPLFSGSATGSRISATATGTDANIGFEIIAKGAAPACIESNGNFAFCAENVTASAVNRPEMRGSATGAAVTFQAAGSDSNVPIQITPKGTSLTLLGSICTITGTSPQVCNGQRGIVTTGTLTTAAVTATTFQITNSSVTTSSLVMCTNQAYSGTYVTNGEPVIMECKPGSGTITVGITNVHATNALNGTLQLGFTVLN